MPLKFPASAQEGGEPGSLGVPSNPCPGARPGLGWEQPVTCYRLSLLAAPSVLHPEGE